METEVRIVIDRIKAANKALPKLTAETMARATHKALCELAKEWGQSPALEVMIKRPGEPRYFSDTTCWVVAWEAGPYEWAIPASMALGDLGKLVEPYYSFDLCFYPNED